MQPFIVLIDGPYVIDTSSPKAATLQTVDLALPQPVGLMFGKSSRLLAFD